MRWEKEYHQSLYYTSNLSVPQVGDDNPLSDWKVEVLI
jgi:hypothetical protein